MGEAIFRGEPALPSTPYTLGWQLDSGEWPKTATCHKETEPEVKAEVKTHEATSLQGTGPGGKGPDSPPCDLQMHHNKRHLLLGCPNPGKEQSMAYIKTKDQ